MRWRNLQCPHRSAKWKQDRDRRGSKNRAHLINMPNLVLATTLNRCPATWACLRFLLLRLLLFVVCLHGQLLSLSSSVVCLCSHVIGISFHILPPSPSPHTPPRQVWPATACTCHVCVGLLDSWQWHNPCAPHASFAFAILNMSFSFCGFFVPRFEHSLWFMKFSLVCLC